MAQVLIRNLDDAVVARLKRIAERESVSLEQKLRTLAIAEARRDEERFEAVAARAREQTRGSTLDSTAMIRADRDR